MSETIQTFFAKQVIWQKVFSHEITIKEAVKHIDNLDNIGDQTDVICKIIHHCIYEDCQDGWWTMDITQKGPELEALLELIVDGINNSRFADRCKRPAILQTNVRVINLRLYQAMKDILRHLRRLEYALTGNLEIKIISDMQEGGEYIFENIGLASCTTTSRTNFVDDKCIIYANGYLWDDEQFTPIGENYEGVFHNELEADEYDECYLNNIYYHRDEMIWLEFYGHSIHEHAAELVECAYNDQEVYRDDAFRVLDHRGNECWVHEECDECVTTDDHTYLNDHAAEMNGCWYDDDAGEWREQHERRTSNYFDNPFNSYEMRRYKRDLSAVKLRTLKHNIGMESISYRQFNGMKYTFGIEMETSFVDDPLMAKENQLNVAGVSDGSISGPEFVTGVLTGDSGVEQLKKILDHINRAGGEVNSACGIHVHIGGATFNRRFQIMAIMLGLQVEQDIYSMLPLSRQENTYCKRIDEVYYKLSDWQNIGQKNQNYKKCLDLLAGYVKGCNRPFDRDYNKKRHHPGGHYCGSRYKWLNMNNCAWQDGPSTVEFRCHPGSLEFKKIFNWLKICMAMVNFIENRPRRIMLGFKSAAGYHNGTSMVDSNSVSLEEVIRYTYNKEQSKDLIEYINKRKQKFSLI